MEWSFQDGLPIWQQLYETLRREIAIGGYAPGSKMPTVRELAAQAGVNPNTMQRALSQLESDNLVITNRTAGRTVTEDREILENVRRELAQHQVQTYLQQMALLGYTSQEAAQLLIQEKEETP